MIPTYIRFVAITAALALCGCASPEIVPSTGTRQPTTPEQVRVYQEQPKKYEDLGMVKLVVTPEMKFNERGHSAVGFERLKALAAAKGANGVLLSGERVKSDFRTLVGDGSKFYQVPMQYTPRAAVATAIFVIEE